MQQNFVYISDIHAPWEDWRCIRLAMERMKFLKPSLLVLGGDIMDAYLEGRFVRIGSRIHKLVEELEAGKRVIDALASAAPKARKIIIEGNHEYRHRVAIASLGMVPGYLEGYPGISLEEGLELKERGIEYVPSKAGNACKKIGLLLFTHGDRYGANPAKMEMMDHKCSGLSGHIHRMTEHRETSLTSGIDWKWLTSGMMAKRATYRDKNNEQQGFISGWMNEETGEFHMQHETIHCNGEKGRATLYAPEGAYHADSTASGIVVRLDSNTLVKTEPAKRPSKVAQGTRRRAMQGSKKSYSKSKTIQVKLRNSQR